MLWGGGGESGHPPTPRAWQGPSPGPHRDIPWSIQLLHPSASLQEAASVSKARPGMMWGEDFSLLPATPRAVSPFPGLLRPRLLNVFHLFPKPLCQAGFAQSFPGSRLPGPSPPSLFPSRLCQPPQGVTNIIFLDVVPVPRCQFCAIPWCHLDVPKAGGMHLVPDSSPPPCPPTWRQSQPKHKPRLGFGVSLGV